MIRLIRPSRTQAQKVMEPERSTELHHLISQPTVIPPPASPHLLPIPPEIIPLTYFSKGIYRSLK